MREIDRTITLIDGYTILQPFIDFLLKGQKNGAKYIDVNVDTSHRLEHYHHVSFSQQLKQHLKNKQKRK